VAALHPVLLDASEGRLPGWAQVDKKRLAHMGRVAELMGEWALAAGKSEKQQHRWRAAGYLHDALKNASNKELRIIVPERFARLPGPVLHGPAVAVRLRVEGVKDKGLLKAVTYHTLGHASLGRIGKALYAADFLEPGRNLRNKWRADLRDRMPGDLDDVVADHLARGNRPASVHRWGRSLLAALREDVQVDRTTADLALFELASLAPPAEHPVLPDPWVWARHPVEVSLAVLAGIDPDVLPLAPTPFLLHRGADGRLVADPT